MDAGSQPRIVFVGPDSGWDPVLQSIGHVAQLKRADTTSESIAQMLKDADALVDASIRVPVTDRMIGDAPNLKVISCASTGTDHVARQEANRRGIAVISLRDHPDVIANLTPAAELTWALLMACARKLPAALDHVRHGGWIREEFPGLMLNGRQLGLIGCGRIGGWMARYATAFGMRVVGYDPFVSAMSPLITAQPIDAVVRDSDVVSVHVPLTEETRGVLSAPLLSQIKPGAIVLNTSRGAIVDEAALLAGLKSGRIGAAGLDVLDGEPDIVNHPLLAYAKDHDNLLITPHCGGFSPDAVAIVSKHAASVALAALRGDKP
jgi:D-3-phosphoglycerate dehydrogenase